MKQVARILLISFSAVGLVACGLDEITIEEREQIIAEGVEIRLQDFRERELQKCQTKALERAIALADSTIRARARQEAVEPVDKPPKPEKPMKPASKVLPDSLRKHEQDTIE